MEKLHSGAILKYVDLQYPYLKVQYHTTSGFLYSMYKNLCEYKRKYEENGTRKGKEASIIRTNIQLFFISFLPCSGVQYDQQSKLTVLRFV